jgi:hypothetical protein
VTDLRTLVVAEGDRVLATGHVVRAGAETYLEPREGPGRDRGPGPPSRHAVPLDGPTPPGDWATLAGEWRGGRLCGVTATAPREPEDWWSPRPVGVPPCPPPEGGWPPLTRAELDAAQPVLTPLLRSGAVASAKSLRAGSGVALVVAAADPARVEAVLRPVYGAALCVVRSRWSRSELSAAMWHLDARIEEWAVILQGGRVTADGLVEEFVAVRYVTPDLAAWAGSLPPGMVTVAPWIVPTPLS